MQPAVSAQALKAARLETVGMTMRFGDLLALDDVSITVEPGRLHALLGENGAGKSTLVKCVMGFHQATHGQLMVDNNEVEITDPKAAQTLGFGMVYQHFTLVPSLTGYENLVISRHPVAAVINWKTERARSCRFLILDEPTSVLTPDEADEVLTHIQSLCRNGDVSVLMITHKFREVMAYADHVSVLRGGKLVGEGPVHTLTEADLADMMVGSAISLPQTKAQSNKETRRTPQATDDPAVLSIQGLKVFGRFGQLRVDIDRLDVHAGEIVGIAGVSGNGQTELMESLCGQRHNASGSVLVNGARYHYTREEAHTHGIRFLPEEPLQNACAPTMSVRDNLAFRTFDVDNNNSNSIKQHWLSHRAMRRNAENLVQRFKVKTQSINAPINTLSGGNVQRAVLARELSGNVRLLIISNPCFGLDFNAVSEIRQRIVQAAENGTAVLLLSEDLDEILELADRVAVLYDGRITYNESNANSERPAIGHAMGGKSTASKQIATTGSQAT